MTLSPILLQHIRETEEDRLSSFTLFFRSVTIAPTASYARPSLVKEDTDEIKFRANMLIPGLVAVFAGLLLILVAADMFTHLQLIMVPVLLFLVFMNLLAWPLVLSPKRNYTIILNRNGIAAGNKSFKWSEIMGTAILHLPKGKQGTNYLVIVLQDETYYKCNLGYFISFWGFTDKLASYVEYFNPAI